MFEQGSLFHKVLSVKTNGLSCTCVLIKCKFWVLVANFFFLYGKFYPVDCWGKRRIIGVALRWFHLCYTTQIRIVDFESLFCVCVCACWYYFRWCIQKSLNSNVVPFWKRPISTFRDDSARCGAAGPAAGCVSVVSLYRERGAQRRRRQRIYCSF